MLHSPQLRARDPFPTFRDNDSLPLSGGQKLSSPQLGAMIPFPSLEGNDSFPLTQSMHIKAAKSTFPLIFEIQTVENVT